MRSFWQITQPYKNTKLAKVISSLENAFLLEGEYITSSPISKVIKLKVGEKYYYVKYYYKAGKHLRQFVGRSRLRAEWENLKLFKSLLIPTVEIAAFGHDYKLGHFQRGVVITEELPETTNLAWLHATQPLHFENDVWVQNVCKKIADYTRTLHQHKFVHNDLKWRNILVTMRNNQPTTDIYFIDCPNGSKKFGYLLKRGIIKDLACLDKVAKQCLSNRQRLRFYKLYQQINQLSQKEKQQIKKIVHFFEGR